MEFPPFVLLTLEAFTVLWEPVVAGGRVKTQLQCANSAASELREISTVLTICSTGFQQQGDHFEH